MEEGNYVMPPDRAFYVSRDLVGKCERFVEKKTNKQTNDKE